MNECIVLIGAGSVSFTRGLVADMIRANQPCELRMVDIDPDALIVAERLTKKMIDARKAPITLSASIDRRQMLSGATAVIATVGVGGRRAWEQDVFIPRKYGIYHPVGDSVMPGGTSRALRMISAMLAIAEDVCDLAPNALFFNYGNPMAAVCRAVRKATNAKIVGLCHGVFQVGNYLADTLGVSADRLHYAAVGMNHLSWFTQLRIDGLDYLPRLHQIARERLERFPETAIDNPFSWQLFELFNAFPAVLDRHISEFFPAMFCHKGSYFGKTLGVDIFSFEECIAAGDRQFAVMHEQAFSQKPLPADYFSQFSGEHEQVIDIIESIRTDAGRSYSANLPNRGQIANLPWDAVIECPAIADRNGIYPITQPVLSAGVAGTLVSHFQWVETVVEAALEGNREKVIQAMLLDGAVDSVTTATEMTDELLNAQAAYLPQFTTQKTTNIHEPKF